MDEEKFESLINQGCNCSQSVLCYFAEDFGLDPERAKDLADPFACGMMQARTCGAATGAYMVLGLKYSGQDGVFLADKVENFNDSFCQAQGSTICKDLLEGRDVTSEEGMAEVVEEGLLFSVCMENMKTAIQILEDDFGASQSN